MVAALQSFVSDPDQVNSARLFELQRLLAPILVAEWKVANVVDENALVTCDKGFTPLQLPSGVFGLSIPIDRKNLLAIFPHWRRAIARKSPDGWIPNIVRINLDDPNDVISQNRSCCRWAERFVFGGEIEELAHCQPVGGTVQDGTDPVGLGFPGPGLTSIHEYTWHRLVSYFYDENDAKIEQGFPIDWAAIDEPAFLESNNDDSLRARTINPEILYINQ